MSAVSISSAPDRPVAQAAPLASAALWRSLLLVCCAASMAGAGMVGQPSGFVLADPELGWLLRGMAAIKAGMVLAAIALFFWRFSRPVPRRTAVVYVLGTAALAGASMLIWRLSYLPLAALVFHIAALAVLMGAWRDAGTVPAFLRRVR